MKILLILVTLASSLSVFAQESIHGKGTSVAGCVASAINQTIQRERHENASFTAKITAAFQLKTKYTKNDLTAQVTEQKRTSPISKKELDYLFSEKDLCNPIVGKEFDQEINWELYTVRHLQSAAIFTINTSKDGALKYVSTAKLKNFQREYDNDGVISQVTCELKNIEIKSSKTQAVLFKN